MAVYAWCTKCKRRRDSEEPNGSECDNKVKHKPNHRWRANVQLGGRDGDRLQKTFLLKENADIQERQWLTDHERGVLFPSKDGAAMLFEEVSSEWSLMAKTQNIIKDFKHSEQSRVTLLNKWFGKKPIGSLTNKDGQAWLKSEVDAGKAVGTINRTRRTLKWILDYAVAQEYIEVNPFRLKDLKGANVHDRWMQVDEANALIRAAQALGDTDLVDVVLVALNTGFRKGNLERLKESDITATSVHAVKTKQNKPYSVPMAAVLVPVFKRLIERRLLEGVLNKPLLNTVNLDRRFRRAAILAKLYSDRKSMERVTIHTMRHTFAVWYLKKSDYNIYKLSHLLGHASTAITEKNYARFCERDYAAQAPLINTQLEVIVPPSSDASDLQVNG